MANFLKDRRKALGLSVRDVAKAVGVSPPTVSRWESGEIANMRRDRIAKYAETLHTTPNFIMTGVEEEPKLPSNAIPFNETRYAPIVGSIPAGVPTLAVEDIQGYLTIPYNDNEEYFFLRVSGDSMIGAGINSGDLVLIRKQKCADDGQIVACRVNGDEATLKRYKRQGDTVLLLPENPQYDPRIVSVSDFDRGYAEIIGVALEIRKQI